MRKRRQYLFSVTLLAATAVPLLAQQTTIEIKRPFEARKLAGIVLVGTSNDGVAGVTVEERTEKWMTVLGTTTTDSVGHFALPSQSHNGIHYLRLSAPGFNIMLIRVRVRRSGAEEFSVHIWVAT